MKQRFFDHIDLRVTDIGAAIEFYARLLPALGFTVHSGGGDWQIWQAPGRGPVEFFGFTQSLTHQPNENRIAFWADDREEVDKLAEIVREAGGQNIEGPMLCREYAPGYYAVFFEDPSGNLLEICSRASRPA
jgi:catechol 2,3-dioxygenase-like lactoylglutathione lyase family enzyme